MKLWNDLCGWAGANAAALRLCFRMTVAGLLAYVLAELLALPRAYWAVFSAIIIVQASVGGTDMRVRTEQQVWLDTVRKTCPDMTCLTAAFNARIADLLERYGNDS